MSAPSERGDRLPESYYLANFQEMLAGVQARYLDILPPSYIDFLQRFQSMPESAQCLLVRLLLRKGNYFRQRQLRYSEVGSLSVATDILDEAGMVSIDPPCDPLDWLGLFTKAQWLAKIQQGLLPNCRVADAKIKRAELDQKLLTVLPELTPEQGRALAQEPIVRVLVKPLFTSLKLLYFANARQELSEFVLRDLALVRFESYSLDAPTRQFNQWQQVIDYLELHHIRERFDNVDLRDSTALLQLAQAVSEHSSDDPKLRRHCQRLQFDIARQLERNGALDQALALYGRLALSAARERRARILIQQSKWEDALALCRDMVARPDNDDEAEFAHGVAYRLTKKMKLGYWPKPAVYQPPTEHWALPFIAGHWGQRHPEWNVAHRLSEQGQCFYVENHLFLLVFSLVYWPIFFAPVRGAFSHPFQNAPHDLYAAEFLQLRMDIKQKIDCDLTQSKYLPKAKILACFQAKFGISHRLVNWRELTQEPLTLALERIPTRHWMAIFDHCWADLRRRCKGFPDLIYFPHHGGYELIEVKGPGDTLQHHQRRWLAFFHQYNIAHRVVHLEWQ